MEGVSGLLRGSELDSERLNEDSKVSSRVKNVDKYNTWIFDLITLFDLQKAEKASN